ncbi:hypothetical protein [Streptomyces sp. NPDC046727]|uniref:hypothetical protein n=1 Tax=Streptomyces sp. NPDC046727 TaxID=3155373 RepID=UPI0033CD6FDB
MKRSATAVAALILITAVGCDGQSDTKAQAGPTTSGQAGAARPMTASEVRRAVVSVNQREDTENWDAAFWRKTAEGPWLEQRLAAVDNHKKYGAGTEPEPTGSPKVSSRVHAWAAAGPADDRWILGAYEARSASVGDTENSARLYWSLYHQQKGEGWRRAFLALAPSRSALPAPATGHDGQAVVSGDVSKLAASPSSVCRRYDDYITGKSGTAADDALWGKDIRTVRASFKSAKTHLRADFDNPASISLNSDPQPTHLGPVWRTVDGGALVACVDVTKTAIDMGPGRYIKLSYSGWPGTTGIRWAAMTQSQLNMIVLKVPVGSHEVSIAAQVSLPYHFDGTRYTGN